jgi:hypothetical protein
MPIGKDWINHFATLPTDTLRVTADALLIPLRDPMFFEHFYYLSNLAIFAYEEIERRTGEAIPWERIQSSRGKG